MTKKQVVIYNWLMKKPGYIKWSISRIILNNSNWLYSDIQKALKQARIDLKLGIKMISPKQTKVVLKTKELIIKAVKAKPLNTKEALELIEAESIKKVKSIVKPKFKRLFFDIETSPNIVSSWRVGYNLNITPDNIIQERGIICVCWKWAGESKVHSLQWNKGDDKQLVIDFMKIMNSADEIIGHNSIKFDTKWLKTRALIHGIEHFPTYKEVDTLKLARSGYLFNSNKMDYIGQVLGVGNKMATGGFGLWKAIFLDNDSKAMDKMVKYCKVDVIRLQQIYDKLNPYTLPKTHVGVHLGGNKCDCTNCGSKHTVVNGTRVSASGISYKQLKCKDCGKYHQVTENIWNTRNK